MADLNYVYRHKKTGHSVTILHLARLQTAWPSVHLNDMDVMVVYMHDGNVWIRSEKEFDDGRFEKVTSTKGGLT